MSTQKSLDGHLIHNRIKCHFFITNINKDKRNKMREAYLRIFIMNVLLLIISPPSGGRHPTTEYFLYTILANVERWFNIFPHFFT